ncbi:hypothetical protein ACO0RG_003886 [Hanseniaspora osmophila]
MKLLKLPEPPFGGNVTSMLTLQVQNSSATGVANQYLLTCSENCIIHVWDINDLKKASENSFEGIPQPKIILNDLELAKTTGCLDHTFNFKLLCTNVTNSKDGNQNTTLYAITDKNVYLLSHFEERIKTIELENQTPQNTSTKEESKPAIFSDNKYTLFELAENTEKKTIIDAQSVNEYLFLMVELIDSKLEKHYSIKVFKSQDIDALFEVKLSDIPASFIVDPHLDYFTVFNTNKSVKFYRFSISLKYGEFYSKLHSTICNVNPIHYKLNMAPQGNFIPLINAVTSSKVGSTLICDFNNKYKVVDSLITPTNSNFQILKYSPKVCVKPNKKNPTSMTIYNLIATTNLTDDSVMIWNTHRKKPLFQGSQITYSPTNKAISDITWSTDGMILFLGSKDGFISGLFFTQKELGVPMNASDFDTYSATYKSKLPPLKAQAALKKVSPNSRVNVKNLKATGKEETSKTASPIPVPNGNNAISTSAEEKLPNVISSNTMKFDPPSYKVPKDLKRVAPTLIASSTSADSQSTNANTKSNKKLKKELENIDFLDTSLLIPSVAFSKVRLATPKTRLHFEYKFLNKYRIRVTNGNSTELKPTKISLGSIKLKDKKNSFSNSSQPASAISDGFFETNMTKNGRVAETSGSDSSNSLNGNTSALDPISHQPNVVRSQSETPLLLETAPFLNPSLKSSEESATNPESSTATHEKPFVRHMHYIPKYVTICTGSNRFFAYATDNGYVHVHSVATGAKMFPPLILGVPLSFLESCGSYLSCITTTGQLYCWNIDSLKLKFPVTDVYALLSPTLRYSDDILSRAENITSYGVTNHGVPIVTLSNGDGHMYDEMMQSWMLINDSWWAYGSQYWDLTNTQMEYGGTVQSDGNDENSVTNGHSLSSSHTSNGILKYLESKTNNELHRRGVVKLLQKFAKTMLMKEGFENLEEVVTLAHLENKLLVLLKLKDLNDFENIMVTYCTKLSELDYQARLNEVFQWLYGVDGKDSLFDETLSKHALLKKVLIACAGIRTVQRLTLSYAEALNFELS